VAIAWILSLNTSTFNEKLYNIPMRYYVYLAIIILLAGSCSQKREPIVWQSIEQRLQTQMITISDGDTLNLPEGNFMFTKSLSMEGKSNILIRGKGIDKTVLSFKNQTEGAQGLLISNGKNIVLEDFSVEDAKGDNMKVSEVNGLTLRRIRSAWSDGPKTENGAYALYPVMCKHVLMEECMAIGSSDAGIYVGQSDSVIIRNNIAFWNVAGIESENSRWVEIYGNEAYDNTGGLLVFDLPGLTSYGHTTRIYKNRIHDNNHENFATKGNIVASIPPGTGILILATHHLEMSDNDIINNRSIGVGIISYELVAAMNKGEQEQEGAIGGVQTVDNRYKEDSLYNAYPYQISIHNNRFENSFWFPSFQNELGKLFVVKSFMHPPDIVYDGIPDPARSRAEICVRENGEVVFMNLDAAHEFTSLSKDPQPFDCEGVKIGQ
jgi:parallel beta-helix repeat protein